MHRVEEGQVPRQWQQPGSPAPSKAFGYECDAVLTAVCLTLNPYSSSSNAKHREQEALDLATIPPLGKF